MYAHSDHRGRIPLLMHKGFKDKIYSTQATKELALALFKKRNRFDRTKMVLVEKPEEKCTVLTTARL
jgi:Cft2 family RNA processing exonuclease